MLHYLGHIRPLVQEVLEGLVEQVAGKEGQGAQEERRKHRHGAGKPGWKGFTGGTPHGLYPLLWYLDAGQEFWFTGSCLFPAIYYTSEYHYTS